MAQWSAATAEILRAQLRPFGTLPVSRSAEYKHYCQYYGIDFSAGSDAVQHQFGAVQSGKFTLAVQLWTQADAHQTVLLLHGLYDHTGLYSKLIAYGLEQGFNVLMFDLPGHGLSSGEPAIIDDFGDYAQSIDDVLTAVDLPAVPLWVMGQSTGCAALIEFSRRYRWPFSHAVLLAPLVRPAHWFLVRTAHRLLCRFRSTVRRGFANNSSDAQFLTFIRRDPLQPTQTSLRWIAALRRWLQGLDIADLNVGPVLVIQGDSDNTVDWRYNVPVVQTLFPGSEVHTIVGAGHQLANESKPIRERYLGLVSRFIAG